LWSNRYFVTGPEPADSAHWTTFSDAVVTAEKAVLHTSTTIVQALGYEPGNDVPVWTKTYSTAGTYTGGGGREQQAEVAALVRYSTNARSTKNHPIYCFNYYHRVSAAAMPDADMLISAQRTLFQTYAALWVAGFSDGTNLMVRCTPQGEVATGYTVDQYLTHRDFPRA
jgi:hypothetical protein